MNGINLFNYFFFKSYLDKIFALFIGIAAAPLVIIFTMISAVQLKAFPLYSQMRSSSLKSNKFKIFKIRTLNKTYICTHIDLLNKKEITSCSTGFCRWLRRTGLDELPQLYNVLRGNMSLVGPRPLTLTDLVNMKTAQPLLYFEREKIKLKPGITGWWQVNKKKDTDIFNLVEMDNYYKNNISLKLDMKIILKTILLVWKAGNTDSIKYIKDKLYSIPEIPQTVRTNFNG